MAEVDLTGLPGKVCIVSDENGMVRGVGASFYKVGRNRDDVECQRELMAREAAWRCVLRDSVIRPFAWIIEHCMLDFERREGYRKICEHFKWREDMRDVEVPDYEEGGDG